MATTHTTKPLIFRKGLDMKEAVAGELAAAYHSGIVEEVRANDFQHRAGRLTVHLAREFGFCYGVDRAVDYAYQARRRFPDQNVYLTGEIIHNPHVNDRLRAAGIRFLSESAEPWEALGPRDVVILPAFGVTVGDMARLVDQGCTLVDTTCGSVLNVWKNVVRYAQDGYTAVIHGKIKHEETRATASQALEVPAGTISGRPRSRGGASRLRLRPVRRQRGRVPRAVRRRRVAGIRSRSRPRADRLRQPDDHAHVRIARDRRDGAGGDDRPLRRGRRSPATSAPSTPSAARPRNARTRSWRSSTQSQPLDLMLVVGGYNSSNTCNLARICAERVPTFHIADPDCLVSADEIRHRPVGAPSTTVKVEEVTRGWLPSSNPLTVGLTAGASTPNNIVGEVIERLSNYASS